MSFPHLWHDGLSIFTLDVSEGHLSTLMVVDLQLWMIYVGDILQRDWQKVSNDSELTEDLVMEKRAVPTLLLDHHPSHTDSRVCGHLNGSKTSSREALLSQLGRSI